ncbi:tetratricopeptide repeat protein [Gluconacetobacter entanii]|uniref:hypothetical protein n=1 Tax=Gluconacetobacter entanii TaxID=108528 RepID=UPI002235DEC2|nr:hypothetical protein [Gluconacetobacter entanii]MCW4579581.1 hypothetical protein [Gluconacetobacter entanii]MCW4582987.1 hypothetical protein [Gluconacetobacter entanii]MCW4586383.1 hypothetical protein [Gluconacetobacter entanii]
MKEKTAAVIPDPDVPYKYFIPADGFNGTLSEAEHAYLAQLIDYAHSVGRRPALMFTRSLGRAQALKKAFSGKSIFLHRNLFHQWGSYSGQAVQGNNFFIATLNTIIENCQHDPVVRMLDEWFSDRKASPENRDMFFIFLLFHLYTYTCAFPAADLAIDSTRIASDRVVREETEAGLNALLGRHISLHDARLSFEISTLEVRCGQPERDTVDQCLKLMLPEDLDPACRDFIHQAKDDAFAEWEKNDFYSNGIRSLLISKETQSDAFRHERDNLAKQYEALNHNRDALIQERDAAIRERDSFIQERDAALHERDSFIQERDAALHERDTIAGQHAADQTRLEERVRSLESEKAAQQEKIAYLLKTNHDLSTDITAIQDNPVRNLIGGTDDRQASWPCLTVDRFLCRFFLRQARRAARRKKWAIAAQWYERLLTYAPNDFASWRQYGNMLRELDNREGAIRAYRIVLSHHPQDSEVRQWL